MMRYAALTAAVVGATAHASPPSRAPWRAPERPQSTSPTTSTETCAFTLYDLYLNDNKQIIGFCFELVGGKSLEHMVNKEFYPSGLADELLKGCNSSEETLKSTCVEKTLTKAVRKCNTGIYGTFTEENGQPYDSEFPTSTFCGDLLSKDVSNPLWDLESRSDKVNCPMVRDILSACNDMESVVKATCQKGISVPNKEDLEELESDGASAASPAFAAAFAAAATRPVAARPMYPCQQDGRSCEWKPECSTTQSNWQQYDSTANKKLLTQWGPQMGHTWVDPGDDCKAKFDEPSCRNGRRELWCDLKASTCGWKDKTYSYSDCKWVGEGPDCPRYANLLGHTDAEGRSFITAVGKTYNTHVAPHANCAEVSPEPCAVGFKQLWCKKSQN